MRVNTDRLRGKIVEQRLTQERVAALLHMDRSTFTRKMKSDALDFSVGEMHQIANILHLSSVEASEIFLAQNSQ